MDCKCPHVLMELSQKFAEKLVNDYCRQYRSRRQLTEVVAHCELCGRRWKLTMCVVSGRLNWS